MKILGFAGSIRKDSYNKATLRAAVDLSPAGMEIETFDLINIPMFSQDLEVDGFPKIVQEFRQKMTEADGLLIVTPEYSGFFSGVLKNTLDWASRNAGGGDPLTDKPVAMMSASTGGFGGAKAQEHLKTLLTNLHTNLYHGRAQVLVSRSADKFDQEGNLTDDKTRERIVELLLELQAWVKKFS